MDSSITNQNLNLWNSLEIVKLLISIITPIVVAYIAFKFSKIATNLANKNWTNQKIIEKRIEIYDLIVPKLNDLLCFYCYIGNWKEITPDKTLEIKRELDKKINIYSALFSPKLLDSYQILISLCFETFTGWGKDAKIKSLYGRRKDCFGKEWNDEWCDRFSEENEVVDIKKIRKSYLDIMEVLKNDMEIYRIGKYCESDIPNINFK
jgi:hypothetical protein